MDVGVWFSSKAVKWHGLVREALLGVHENVSVDYGGELDPPDEALDIIRGQYSARELIRYLKSKERSPAIWILGEDLYTPGMNFVFGQALAGEAAVLSARRLQKAGLVAKEAVHEFGHLLGLRHCKNLCVMEYANSLREAEDKPNEFCASCRSIIDTLLEDSKGEGLSK